VLKVIKTIQFRNISEPWQRKMRESDAAIQFCAACDGMSSLEVWFSRVLARLTFAAMNRADDHCPLRKSRRLAAHGETTSMDTHTTAPNRRLEVKGVRYAYRQFGSQDGTPLLLCNISAAECITRTPG
jgi:hypothetical protein